MHAALIVTQQIVRSKLMASQLVFPSASKVVCRDGGTARCAEKFVTGDGVINSELLSARLSTQPFLPGSSKQV